MAAAKSGRYRKIHLKMYGDEKYLRLSRCPPCGQALWWHLLAGPQTRVIPGLCSIGECAFAEHLGWSLQAFRRSFKEVVQLGMAEADWVARVVWVPNAVRYNPPGSPNVVLSWRTPWEEVSECELKTKAYWLLRSFNEGLGKAFLESFDNACLEPSVKALFKSSLMPSSNQEQEQEQEQEQDTPLTPQGGNGVLPSFEEFWNSYPRKEAKAAAARAWARLNPGPEMFRSILSAVRSQIASGCLRSRTASDGRSVIPYPASWINGRRWEDQGEPEFKDDWGKPKEPYYGH